MPIISDRETVIALAVKHQTESLNAEPEVSAAFALRTHYGLSKDDSIWSGSEAAICMGYTERGPDENLMDEIVRDVAEEVSARICGTEVKP